MRSLGAIVEEIEQFKAAGLNLFQAMCASLEDDEWEQIFAHLKSASDAEFRADAG